MQVVKFVHEQYEKISDDVYYIGNNTVLRFNVLLAHRSEDGTRYPYHKEYEYTSDKYSNVNYNLVTIRRNFDYFLSIENIKKIDNDKEYIMIRIEDMYYVLNQFNMAYRWFTDPSYKNLFVYDKNKKMIIFNRPESIYISNLAMDKYIILDPIVIDYSNGEQQRGIRLTLSNKSNYIDISIPKFEGLLYTLSTFNMYECALGAINYLQRPEFGTNCYSFNSITDVSNTGYVEGGGNGRQIKSNARSKSFFDKIDSL